MRDIDDRLAQQLLDEVGGEPLKGSGFEEDTPDYSSEIVNPHSPTDTHRRSGTKKERRNVE